jgi:replicative DNA helicase
MTDAPNHTTPQSLEAEEAVLGAMLISGVAVEVAEQLGMRPDHFYRQSHQTIFTAIREIAARGVKVDELVLVNDLKHRRCLTEVGGHAAILSLVERVPAVANVRAYAQEVLDQATLRRLVETGHAIATLGYEHPADPSELVSQAAEMAADLDAPSGAQVEWVDMDDLLAPLYDTWTERAKNGGGFVGTSTGFVDVDRRIGGLKGGNLVVVAGRPGMGKSSWAMNVAEHIAIVEGQHVAVYNFEMDPEDLASRMMSSLAKVDGKRLTNTAPLDDDWQPLSDAMTRVRERAPGRLKFSPAASLTPVQIRSRTRRLKRKLERKAMNLGLVVIDYIGLMDAGKRLESREKEIAYISREMKAMARELDVPVLLLSQLNRGVESRPNKRPMLSDLRESGAVEQDADVVILLYREDYYAGEQTPDNLRGIAEAIVAKNRNGEPGTVFLAWLDKYTRFATLAANANPRRTAA